MLNMLCCTPKLQPASRNYERDAPLLEATVNAAGNNVGFRSGGHSGLTTVMLQNCSSNFHHLNAIATSVTICPTPSPSAINSAPMSSPSSHPEHRC